MLWIWMIFYAMVNWGKCLFINKRTLPYMPGSINFYWGREGGMHFLEFPREGKGSKPPKTTLALKHLDYYCFQNEDLFYNKEINWLSKQKYIIIFFFKNMKTSDQNIITTKILSKRQCGHYLMLTRNSMDI